MTNPTVIDPTQSNESAGTWLVKLPAAASVDRRSLADLNDDLIRNARPTRGKRVLLAAARFAVTFGIGIAATLMWQPYGDAAREMIANASPQFGWLAPQPASAAQGASGQEVPGQGVPGLQPRDARSADLDAVRERVDRIATGQDQMTRTIGQITVSQERIAQEIAKLREVEQYLLYKTSYKEPEPAARPAAPAGATHKPSRRPTAASAGR